MTEPLLRIENINTYYGFVHALVDVSMEVHPGEFVVLLGANGAGKSTLLQSVMGLVKVASGTIAFDGEDVTNRGAAHIVGRGIAMTPEGRHLFGDLTVLENLQIGARARRLTRAEVARGVDDVMALFPKLGERRSQKAGTMSGGEQQMVAIGRALMARPRILLLDEPSLGLAPLLVRDLMAALATIHAQGTTLLLVEQNVSLALQAGQRAYVLQMGHVVLQGSAADLRDSDEIRKAYLGEDSTES